MVPGEEHGLDFTLHDIMPIQKATEAASGVPNLRAGDDVRASGSPLPAESARDAAPAGPEDQGYLVAQGPLHQPQSHSSPATATPQQQEQQPPAGPHDATASDVALLYGIHDSVAAAAAAAGALVHVGESVARAANIAEAALDPPGTVDFDSARTTYHPAAEHATSAAVVGAPSGAASVPEDSRDDDLPGMQLPPFGSTASTAASAATPTAVAPPAALPAPPVEGADAGGLGVNARPPEEGAGGSGVAGLPGVGLGAGAGTAGEVGASGSSGTGTGGATAASAISCWFHIFTELQRRRGAIPVSDSAVSLAASSLDADRTSDFAGPSSGGSDLLGHGARDLLEASLERGTFPGAMGAAALAAAAEPSLLAGTTDQSLLLLGLSTLTALGAPAGSGSCKSAASGRGVGVAGAPSGGGLQGGGCEGAGPSGSVCAASSTDTDIAEGGAAGGFEAVAGLVMPTSELEAQQQAQLRAVAGRAAAVAGALVHCGQGVARAASLAEVAVKPGAAVDQDSALQATGAGGGREQRPQEEMAPTAAEAAEETVEAEAATEHEMGDDEEAASDTDEEQLLAGLLEPERTGGASPGGVGSPTTGTAAAGEAASTRHEASLQRRRRKVAAAAAGAAGLLAAASSAAADRPSPAPPSPGAAANPSHHGPHHLSILHTGGAHQPRHPQQQQVRVAALLAEVALGPAAAVDSSAAHTPEDLRLDQQAAEILDLHMPAPRAPPRTSAAGTSGNPGSGAAGEVAGARAPAAGAVHAEAAGIGMQETLESVARATGLAAPGPHAAPPLVQPDEQQQQQPFPWYKTGAGGASAPTPGVASESEATRTVVGLLPPPPSGLPPPVAHSVAAAAVSTAAAAEGIAEEIELLAEAAAGHTPASGGGGTGSGPVTDQPVVSASDAAAALPAPMTELLVADRRVLQLHGDVASSAAAAGGLHYMGLEVAEAARTAEAVRHAAREVEVAAARGAAAEDAELGFARAGLGGDDALGRTLFDGSTVVAAAPAGASCPEPSAPPLFSTAGPPYHGVAAAAAAAAAASIPEGEPFIPMAPSPVRRKGSILRNSLPPASALTGGRLPSGGSVGSATGTCPDSPLSTLGGRSVRWADQDASGAEAAESVSGARPKDEAAAGASSLGSGMAAQQQRWHEAGAGSPAGAAMYTWPSLSDMVATPGGSGEGSSGSLGSSPPAAARHAQFGSGAGLAQPGGRYVQGVYGSSGSSSTSSAFAVAPDVAAKAAAGTDEPAGDTGREVPERVRSFPLEDLSDSDDVEREDGRDAAAQAPVGASGTATGATDSGYTGDAEVEAQEALEAEVEAEMQSALVAAKEEALLQEVEAAAETEAEAEGGAGAAHMVQMLGGSGDPGSLHDETEEGCIIGSGGVGHQLQQQRDTPRLGSPVLSQAPPASTAAPAPAEAWSAGGAEAGGAVSGSEGEAGDSDARAERAAESGGYESDDDTDSAVPRTPTATPANLSTTDPGPAGEPATEPVAAAGRPAQDEALAAQLLRVPTRELQQLQRAQREEEEGGGGGGGASEGAVGGESNEGPFDDITRELLLSPFYTLTPPSSRGNLRAVGRRRAASPTYSRPNAGQQRRQDGNPGAPGQLPRSSSGGALKSSGSALRSARRVSASSAESGRHVRIAVPDSGLIVDPGMSSSDEAEVQVQQHVRRGGVEQPRAPRAGRDAGIEEAEEEAEELEAAADTATSVGVAVVGDEAVAEEGDTESNVGDASVCYGQGVPVPGHPSDAGAAWSHAPIMEGEAGPGAVEMGGASPGSAGRMARLTPATRRTRRFSPPATSSLAPWLTQAPPGLRHSASGLSSTPPASAASVQGSATPGVLPDTPLDDSEASESELVDVVPGWDIPIPPAPPSAYAASYGSAGGGAGGIVAPAGGDRGLGAGATGRLTAGTLAQPGGGGAGGEGRSGHHSMASVSNMSTWGGSTFSDMMDSPEEPFGMVGIHGDPYGQPHGLYGSAPAGFSARGQEQLRSATTSEDRSHRSGDSGRWHGGAASTVSEPVIGAAGVAAGGRRRRRSSLLGPVVGDSSGVSTAREHLLEVDEALHGGLSERTVDPTPPVVPVGASLELLEAHDRAAAEVATAASLVALGEPVVAAVQQVESLATLVEEAAAAHQRAVEAEVVLPVVLSPMAPPEAAAAAVAAAAAAAAAASPVPSDDEGGGAPEAEGLAGGRLSPVVSRAEAVFRTLSISAGDQLGEAASGDMDWASLANIAVEEGFRASGSHALVGELEATSSGGQASRSWQHAGLAAELAHSGSGPLLARRLSRALSPLPSERVGSVTKHGAGAEGGGSSSAVGSGVGCGAGAGTAVGAEAETGAEEVLARAAALGGKWVGLGRQAAGAAALVALGEPVEEAVQVVEEVVPVEGGSGQGAGGGGAGDAEAFNRA